GIADVTALDANPVDGLPGGVATVFGPGHDHDLGRFATVFRSPVIRDMYRDHAVYVRAAVHELALTWLTRDTFSAEITTDGVPHMLHGLTDVVGSGTALYAGEWLIDPRSRHDDGVFEIVPFKGMSDWTSKLITRHKKSLITEEKLSRIGVPRDPVLRGKTIEIVILRPFKDKRLPSQLDGEEFTPADHFRIDVHRRMLNIIVPRNFHWI
ncbi:MAG: hypothetical protein PHU25_22050, partial [Deltaproteobacteria bacterium]|nr:hypothetical protein [Deltaproteobacteria bacterium]